MAFSAKSPTGLAEQILAHARIRLAEGGFKALTLRPLAQACGFSLAAVTYHFGAKTQLVERLVTRERQIDRERHAEFAARFADLPSLLHGALTAVLEAYLDDSAGPGAETTMIWTELLLAGGWDVEARSVILPWIEERWAFWRTFFAGRLEGAEGWAAAAMSYVTDEAVHSLAQRKLEDYRLLRRMSLERWGGRFPLTAPGLSQSAFFDAVVKRLDPGLALPEPDAPATALNDRRSNIAQAAAAVIVLDGVEAITHRAVADRAGVPASTVAYHFTNRMDLVRAGMATVYLIAQGKMALKDVEPGLAVARGTVSVALAAARDADLLPFAVDLRRQRGANLHGRLPELGGDRRRFDLCAAQAASVLLLGSRLIGQSLEAAGALGPLDVGSVLDWIVSTPTEN